MRNTYILNAYWVSVASQECYTYSVKQKTTRGTKCCTLGVKEIKFVY